MQLSRIELHVARSVVGDGFVVGATHLLPANGMVRVPEAVQIKVEVVAHGMS